MFNLLAGSGMGKSSTLALWVMRWATNEKGELIFDFDNFKESTPDGKENIS